jgi:hypothetical protein
MIAKTSCHPDSEIVMMLSLCEDFFRIAEISARYSIIECISKLSEFTIKPV